MSDSYRSEYDVVIVGAGLAGSTTALCLANSGLSVLVLDHKQHPRFTIGESTVPTTSLNFNHIGETFGIPELHGLSVYGSIAPRNVVTTFPKCGFWFGLHEEGKEMAPDSDLWFETFSPPNGPDTHLIRSELDQYLTTLYSKYKVHLLENTTVVNFEQGKDGVQFQLESRGRKKVVDLAKSILEDSNVEHAGDEKDKMSSGESSEYTSPPTARTVKAKFVVDASGHAAFLGRKFGLKQKEAKLSNRTRTIYGHFEYPAERNLDNVFGGPPATRFSRNAGTMHHVFEGGWIWVIPFDNNTVSIGIVLNSEQYPYPHDMNKEEEYNHILKKFPTIWKHLGGLKPLTPLVRSSRMQIFSDSILGDRFILTPHASAFVDPLFSTGILMTTRFVIRLVPRLVEAVKANDFSRERFAPMEKQFFKEVKFIDRMVSGMIASFSNYQIFRQFWLIWIEGSFRQTTDAICHRKYKVPLYGSHDKAWRKAVKESWKLVMEWKKNPGKTDALEVASNVEKTLRPLRFLQQTNGYKADVGVVKTVDVRVPARTPYEMIFRKTLNPKYFLLFWFTIITFVLHYYFSKVLGTGFAKALDKTFDQRTPGYKFKFNFFDGRKAKPNAYLYKKDDSFDFDY